ELTGQLQVLVGAEAVMIGVAAPYLVGMVDARRKRADPVLPFVRRSERAAGPADERGRESTQSLEQIGTQDPASADIRPPPPHEVDERRAASGGANLDGRVAIGARARERERHILPR